MGIKFGKLFKSVEEDMVSEDVVPQDVVSEDVVSEDVVPQDVVPEDVVSEDVVPQDVVPQDVVSEDVVPQDVVPQDVVSEDVVPEDVVPQDVVSEDVVPQDVVPQDVASEAGKRKSIEDDEGTQKKHRRLDSTSCDSELLSSSTDTESTNTCEASLSQRSAKRKAVSDDGPETKKRILDLSCRLTAKYQQQRLLGQGGYGSVFAGYRKADNLAVVIKHIPRNTDLLTHEDDTGKQIPMEVAVMLKLAAESERHSAPIDLLDWYDLGQELILVLERPKTAVDLRQYIAAKRGCIEEKEVKIIIRQLVDAAIHLQEKHIFHRDIKMENLLIETGMKAPRVRVIDFGASCFVEEGEHYDYFLGTHAPPECHRRQKYEAGPTTVFQIGVCLGSMLQNPNLRQLQSIKWGFSENLRNFSKACMHKDPEQRPTLEQLRNHVWLR